LILNRSVAVGTATGFQLFTLNSTDNLEPIYESRKLGMRF
jgi:hypothetical protein